MRLTFIDLETTSLDLDKCEVIQLGYRKIINGKVLSEVNTLYKNTTERISLESKNLHGITEFKLKDKEVFLNSKDYETLKLSVQDSIYVAHNGQGFDFPVLKRLGISFPYTIDTAIIATILLDDLYNELEQTYKLGVLRYFFEDRGLLTFDKEMSHHNAYDDILILEQVFYCLFNLYKEQNPSKTDQEILKDFVLLSRNKVLLPRFPFGTNKGKRFDELKYNSVTWMRENFTDLAQNLKFSLDYRIEQCKAEGLGKKYIPNEKFLNWEDYKLNLSNFIQKNPYVIQLENQNLKNPEQLSLNIDTVKKVETQTEKEGIKSSIEIEVPKLEIPEPPEIKYKEGTSKKLKKVIEGELDIDPQKFVF